MHTAQVEWVLEAPQRKQSKWITIVELTTVKLHSIELNCIKLL
jgi:hypothetical protein